MSELADIKQTICYNKTNLIHVRLSFNHSVRHKKDRGGLGIETRKQNGNILCVNHLKSPGKKSNLSNVHPVLKITIKRKINPQSMARKTT